VRWAPETGSTNTDLLALARDGEPEGVVLVADHQHAGRGRQGRSFEAPPGASLLVSVLLRPPAAVAALVTMAGAVAGVRAVAEVAGVAARVKWPNDLVWPGDGSAPDRKLAGVLAEADWATGTSDAAGPRQPAPRDRVAVVLGMGLNVDWPDPLPDELADIAVALNHLVGGPVDRGELLSAWLQSLESSYQLLLAGARDRLVDDWRAVSATLGRRVRVDLGTCDVVGMAVDVTADGHLVVRTDDDQRVEVAAGDVVHLRPT
jgi:BirA family biotin operon repressor/biotin-[acetyl-CoA-carboxylase] ligase